MDKKRKIEYQKTLDEYKPINFIYDSQFQDTLWDQTYVDEHIPPFIYNSGKDKCWFDTIFTILFLLKNNNLKEYLVSITSIKPSEQLELFLLDNTGDPVMILDRYDNIGIHPLGKDDEIFSFFIDIIKDQLLLNSFIFSDNLSDKNLLEEALPDNFKRLFDGFNNANQTRISFVNKIINHPKRSFLINDFEIISNELEKYLESDEFYDTLFGICLDKLYFIRTSYLMLVKYKEYSEKDQISYSDACFLSKLIPRYHYKKYNDSFQLKLTPEIYEDSAYAIRMIIYSFECLDYQIEWLEFTKKSFKSTKFEYQLDFNKDELTIPRTDDIFSNLLVVSVLSYDLNDIEDRIFREDKEKYLLYGVVMFTIVHWESWYRSSGTWYYYNDILKTMGGKFLNWDDTKKSIINRKKELGEIDEKLVLFYTRAENFYE